jgi:hypothetical protein
MLTFILITLILNTVVLGLLFANVWHACDSIDRTLLAILHRQICNPYSRKENN